MIKYINGVIEYTNVMIEYLNNMIEYTYDMIKPTVAYTWCAIAFLHQMSNHRVLNGVLSNRSLWDHAEIFHEALVR